MAKSSRFSAALWLSLGLLSTACMGGIDSGESARATCAPGGAPFRRMTRGEYNNTVRDLLGDTTEPANTFAAEEQAYGFNNNSAALTVTPLLGEQYMNAAEQIAGRAVTNMNKLVACDTQKSGEDTCAHQFIAAFGMHAFRRPLVESESDTLFKVYTWGRQQGDFQNGIRLVIETALQSPPFLYRLEFGAPGATGNTVRLSAFETASRLSYLLWNTMPDETLFQAAQAGQLATKEQVAAQAMRMVADPRARDAVAEFHAQWLSLDDINQMEKDDTVYPTFKPALGAAMRTETEKFVDSVFWDGDGLLNTMLTGKFTFINKDLGALYGLSGASGSDFVRVQTDGVQRGGLLTQAGLLAVLAKPDQTSPVIRGKFVREQLLCMQLPPPPPNVNPQPPALDPNLTTRQRFAAHSQDPACSICHRLMDPVGLGFENYDGLGKWRSTENGKMVDASGLINESDIPGPFNGVMELEKKLASSAQAQGCIVTQWFRYAYGRLETTQGDACALDALKKELMTSGGNLKALLVALTQSDAFLFRTVPDDGRMP